MRICRLQSYGLLLSMGLAATAVAQEGQLPDQVLVVRCTPDTGLSYRRLPGDKVLRLTWTNPPKDLHRAISKQQGSFVERVEHLSLERSTLTVLLHLTNDAVKVSTKKLSNPTAWAIELAPKSTPEFPKRSELIGYLPGLIPPPQRPALFPLEPSDTPCSGAPDANVLEYAQPPTSAEALENKLALIPNKICRTWASSRLAALALEQGGDTSAFAVWAFRFFLEDKPWPLQREARAQTSLVAAEVLARNAYFPEAEVLLADADRYRREHAPYRAMALANLFALQGNHAEAETLYSEIVRAGYEPWMIHRASLARALNSLEGQDVLGTLKFAEEAVPLVASAEKLPGDLWFVAGEAALSLGELSLARQHYERAARSPTPSLRAIAAMRLADLEFRAQRSESAITGWKLAEKMGFDCAFDHIRLRTMLANETNLVELEAYLQSTANYNRCQPVRMEAKYVIALTQVLRGQEMDALGPAQETVRDGVSRWGPVRAHRALIGRVASSAIKRKMRHRDFAGLVEFFERDLAQLHYLLSPVDRLNIARAYHRIGASRRAADELVDLITEQPEIKIREEILITLGEALVGAGDMYRADLVIRHLNARHRKGKQVARQAALRAHYELAINRPQLAIKHVGEAQNQYPPGDRRAELGLIKARASLDLGQTKSAIEALEQALQTDALTPSQLKPAATEVLSECARSCSKSILQNLSLKVSKRLGPEALSPRLVKALGRRGVLASTSGQSSPSLTENSDDSADSNGQLWSRLEKLGIDASR